MREKQSEAGEPSCILITWCPDTTGIVAAVAGFLASHNALITEAQHYDDPSTDTSFMRTGFRDNDQGMPAIAEVHLQFGENVARRFKMSWQFHAARRKGKTLHAVSRHEQCLNSILHRCITCTLPLEDTAAVSNHQDLRSPA